MTRASPEARKLSRALRQLAPRRVDPSPIIKTGLPFYGAKVGDIRKLARGWVREHGDVDPTQVVDLCDELWHTTVREEILLACFMLDRNEKARDALTSQDFLRWLPFLDNWETTDQVGMLVLAPWIVAAPELRFGELEQLSTIANPWGRRLALVGTRGLARTDDAKRYWPRVAKLVLQLASQREAAMPKAISWVLREYLRNCSAQVATFVERHRDELPAIAVRETRNKLAGPTKRASR